MAEVSLDVSNEVPASHRVTLVGVTGSGFQPCTQVNIGIFGPGSQRVLAHTVQPVGADGSCQWGTGVSPQLACNSSASAIVHDSDGAQVNASADVFCP